MSTTTYQADAQPRVGAALGELATACKHLVAALAARVSAPVVAASARRANRAAEAAQARRIADRWVRTDHRMASDIYCAADRHETSGE